MAFYLYVRGGNQTRYTNASSFSADSEIGNVRFFVIIKPPPPPSITHGGCVFTAVLCPAI